MGLMGAGLGTSGVGLAWDFYVHEIVRDVGEVESIFAPPHLMIWGIVAPAIFVSYALLGILVGFPSDGDGSHALRVLFPVLWAPWAAIGLVATATLWRSVGLVIPRRSAQRWEGLLTGAIIVGIIFAGFAAIAVAKVPVAEFAWVLTAQGVGVVTMGAGHPRPRGRRPRHPLQSPRGSGVHPPGTRPHHGRLPRPAPDHPRKGMRRSAHIWKD